MLIDSHCHLDFFEPDEVAAVLARAAAAGVEEVVTIGTRLTGSEQVFAIAEAHANVWCTVGVHPHHAAEHPVPEAEAIAALTAHPRCIGIGDVRPAAGHSRPRRRRARHNYLARGMV
jgi:TatD DNase family protein